jgi:hypothetical protein
LKKEKSLPDQEHKQRDLTHDLDVQAASKAHHRISHIYGNVAQNLYPDLCGSELVPKVVWIQSTIYNNSKEQKQLSVIQPIKWDENHF